MSRKKRTFFGKAEAPTPPEESPAPVPDMAEHLPAESEDPEHVLMAGLFLIGTGSGSVDQIMQHLEEALQPLHHQDRRARISAMKASLAGLRQACQTLEVELRRLT